MRNIWAICKREWVSYFVTPVGYVIVGAYALISGLGFSAAFIMYCKITESPGMYGYSGVPDFEENLLSPFLVFCGMLVLFIGPLITMRLLAEERRRGTMELLLTQPVKDREIIFGKYAAALGLLFILLAIVGVQLLILAWYTDVEPAVLLFGLMSVFLMGAAFLSLGLFVSAITKSQITAGATTLGLWLCSWILGSLGKDLPLDYPAPESLSETVRNIIGLVYAIFRALVQALPLDAHAQDLAQGIVQPKDIVYYLLFTALFLFLTFRALDSRRWRA